MCIVVQCCCMYVLTGPNNGDISVLLLQEIKVNTTIIHLLSGSSVTFIVSQALLKHSKHL